MQRRQHQRQRRSTPTLHRANRGNPQKNRESGPAAKRKHVPAEDRRTRTRHRTVIHSAKTKIYTHPALVPAANRHPVLTTIRKPGILHRPDIYTAREKNDTQPHAQPGVGKETAEGNWRASGDNNTATCKVKKKSCTQTAKRRKVAEEKNESMAFGNSRSARRM